MIFDWPSHSYLHVLETQNTSCWRFTYVRKFALLFRSVRTIAKILIFEKVIDPFLNKSSWLSKIWFQNNFKSISFSIRDIFGNEKMKPDFEKMMKKLSESTDMMMMEYADFFQKEVQANYVSRSGTKLPSIFRSLQ